MFPLSRRTANWFERYRSAARIRWVRVWRSKLNRNIYYTCRWTRWPVWVANCQNRFDSRRLGGSWRAWSIRPPSRGSRMSNSAILAAALKAQLVSTARERKTSRESQSSRERSERVVAMTSQNTLMCGGEPSSQLITRQMRNSLLSSRVSVSRWNHIVVRRKIESCLHKRCARKLSNFAVNSASIVPGLFFLVTEAVTDTSEEAEEAVEWEETWPGWLCDRSRSKGQLFRVIQADEVRRCSKGAGFSWLNKIQSATSSSLKSCKAESFLIAQTLKAFAAQIFALSS